jgi:hypothetical protein
MRALIKLVLAALIIYATWRVGSVYLRYYQFKDEVQQTAQFSGQRSENELHTRVLEIAREYQIPLDAERLKVRREDNHTRIDASYVEQIEILPSYRRPWEFTVNIDAFTIVPKEAQ